MAIVYFSLGSNNGERLNRLCSACRLLKEDISITKASSVYETEPMYDTNQPDFLNAVIEVKTKLSPFEILSVIGKVEQSIGRMRSEKRPNGPRNIDIDILLYDNEIINTPNLTIPHRLMYERNFVLIPLVEISPDIIDPVSGVSFKKYLDMGGDEKVYCFDTGNSKLC